jgi:hypothetical protein
VRAGEVNSPDVVLYLPAPDHVDGGLNVAPSESFLAAGIWLRPPLV